jgi:hypothetical protein
VVICTSSNEAEQVLRINNELQTTSAMTGGYAAKLSKILPETAQKCSAYEQLLMAQGISA